MRFRYGFILLSFLLYQLVFSQANNVPVIENVTFEQRTDGSNMVDIYYDVFDADGDFLTINMRVSEDGGEIWDFPCDEVSGDVGDSIVTGTGKHIVWDFGSEHPETEGDQFRIRIIAEDWYWVTGTVTDVDGNVYQTVKIGDQWWMMENLKVTHYSNGDTIFNVSDDAEWVGLTSGARCVYGSDDNNADIYGFLYNWYAVDDSRGLAPEGWHIPSDEEWKQFEMYLGLNRNEADAIGWRGLNEGGLLKETGIDFWNSPNTGATNQSGFTGLPGGLRFGSFSEINTSGSWWSATDSASIYAWRRSLRYDYAQIYRLGAQKRTGYSIRCVRAATANTPPSAFFDVNLGYGNIATVFQFDASGCADAEDNTADLEVRWDWENDGHWDSDYTAEKTAAHQYEANGEYMVRLEVRDIEGITANFQRPIIISDIYDSLTDIDGNIYVTILIGSQWWMMENLKVTHYRNGDEIPNVINDGEWEALTTGAYCAYNNDNNYVDTLGLLYNWFVTSDPRNIAPAGWHVPSDDEWKQLEMHLGMSLEDADAFGWRGTDEGGKLKEAGTDHWMSPNEGATNESGFTALPGNYRIINGTFSQPGRHGLWWTDTEYESEPLYAFRRYLYNSSSQITRNAFYKNNGQSIRLVKD